MCAPKCWRRRAYVSEWLLRKVTGGGRLRHVCTREQSVTRHSSHRRLPGSRSRNRRGSKWWLPSRRLAKRRTLKQIRRRWSVAREIHLRRRNCRGSPKHRSRWWRCPLCRNALPEIGVGRRRSHGTRTSRRNRRGSKSCWPSPRDGFSEHVEVCAYGLLRESSIRLRWRNLQFANGADLWREDRSGDP